MEGKWIGLELALGRPNWFAVTFYNLCEAMHHSIQLSDEAFRAYKRRARRVGLTVDEYLDQSAPVENGFSLTPEMRDGIERGLAQADAGQIVGLGQVRDSLAQYRAEWRASSKR